MASSLFGQKAIQPQPVNKQSAGNSSLDGIRNLMAMMKSGGDSRKMAKAVLSRMPGYQEAMNIVNQYGGDARAAFYAEAEKKGVDPNSILSLLR